MTDAIATKKIAGDSATSVISASGICSQLYAITWAPKNSIKLPTSPITANVANDTLNILYATLLSPIATFSDTSFDIAFGTPIDEIVNSIA